MFPAEALVAFVSEGTPWVLAQRSGPRPLAQPLSSDATGVIRPYFPETCLAAARFCFVSEISNPPFYAALAGLGLGVPVDFRDMAGITFVDTIAISKRFLPESPHGLLELLFHEMVHVVQYDVLGVERFVPEYVYGWVRSGERYETIPLRLKPMSCRLSLFRSFRQRSRSTTLSAFDSLQVESTRRSIVREQPRRHINIAPNPRLQRTRSRSPLSRKPFGEPR